MTIKTRSAGKREAWKVELTSSTRWREGRLAVFLVLAVLCVVSLPASSQQAGPLAGSSIGISVNAPKVYEERALRAMLEQAEAQLAALRPIGGPKFDAAIGTLQGGSQTTTSFSLTAQGLTQPSVVTKETSGQVDGELVTTGVEETTSVPQTTPAPPASPSAAAFTGAGFGLSARDLLTEQTALSYQIAALRLALERATSDRVNSVPDSEGALTQLNRYPVVLGFTIGVDHPRKRQVAEVEITLRLEGTEISPAPAGTVSPPGISLVSVLPAKDAYNVAAVTDSSTNIGVGQVVSAFQLGAGFFQNRKTFYVVRDVDTLSIAHGPVSGEPNVIRVAWQFRPVLGRQIVEPGPRQVFVVLAIDNGRYLSKGFSISAQATTRWTRIGRKGVLRNTAEAESELDLGKLGYWQVFTDELLAPYANTLQLTLLSQQQGMVSVQGGFLSAESRILVGDKVFDRGNGLGFRDDAALSFLVPLIDLARASDVYLINRYQQPVPLRRRDLEDQVSLEMASCRPTRVTGADRYRVEVVLNAKPPVEIKHLLAVVGDTVAVGDASAEDWRGAGNFPKLQTLTPLPCSRAECGQDAVKVSFEVPAESVRRTAQAIIREVFGGPRRAVRCDLPVLPAVDRIVIVGKSADKTRLALQGQRLSLLQHALVAGAPLSFTEKSDALALLDVPSASIEGVEVLLVRARPEAGAQGEILIVPFKQKVEIKKPAFPITPTVTQHFSGPIEVQGENLDSIKQVAFEGLELKKEVAGMKLTIHLVSKVTEQPAPRSLTVTLLDGSEAVLPILVQPRT